MEEILNLGILLNEELMGAIETRVRSRKEAKIAALKNKQADLLIIASEQQNSTARKEHHAGKVLFLSPHVGFTSTKGHFMMLCACGTTGGLSKWLSFVLAERETL